MVEVSVTLDRDKTVTLKYVRVLRQFILTVNALADSTPIAIDITVDAQGVRTQGSLTLNEGSYTIRTPDEIVVAGVTYRYSSSVET